MRSVFCTLCLLFVSCGTFSNPQTLGEQYSGFTYVPLDPFPVATIPGDSCLEYPEQKNHINLTGELSDFKYRSLLDSFPDNTVRISVEQFSAGGQISYGPANVAGRGERYEVTVDYTNSDTIPFKIWLAKIRYSLADPAGEYVDFLDPVREGELVRYVAFTNEIYEARIVGLLDMRRTLNERREKGLSTTLLQSEIEKQEVELAALQDFNIPLYVGVGLRATANVTTQKSSANLSGLGSIGAEAEADRLRGNLVLQTLGINGKSISAALPVQSELNRTTVQNAIVAIGSIKALLYESETVKSPRVVGMYVPFPVDQVLVNQIVSALSTERPSWARPCGTTDRD